MLGKQRAFSATSHFILKHSQLVQRGIKFVSNTKCQDAGSSLNHRTS